jgi:hypothetical protein
MQILNAADPRTKFRPVKITMTLTSQADVDAVKALAEQSDTDFGEHSAKVTTFLGGLLHAVSQPPAVRTRKTKAATV